jgi:hypothetical protein
MMKYLTKTIGVNCRNSDSSDSVQWEEERAAVLTHVWNKVFRCRDVLSKAFKERLNAVRPSRPRTGPKERVWFFFSIDRRISPLRIGPPSITGFYPTKFRPDLSLDQFS